MAANRDAMIDARRARAGTTHAAMAVVPRTSSARTASPPFPILLLRVGWIRSTGTSGQTAGTFHRYDEDVFASLLHDDDARRATEVIEAVLAHGLRCGLTGGLAIDAQLRAHGRPVKPGHLNDIDLVVEAFAAIPESLAASFLQRHVHPEATDGRTLLQLVDEPRAVRVDLFKALGNTLSRARRLDDETGTLEVLSIEDLVARTTAFVCGSLRRGKSIDVKHATAFRRLLGLGRPKWLAWEDHRQQVPGTFDEASREAASLLEMFPELLIVEEYSADAPPCEHCREHGAFRPAPSRRIVEILGYC
jgi:hypothetical protein